MNESRVYQSISGNWIFWDGTMKHFFDTEAEALEVTKKQKFVETVRAMMTTLAINKDQLPVMEEIWNDRSYLTGITTEDLVLMGQDITTTQLAAGITLMGELIKLYGNVAVAIADYGATLSDLRTDK